MIPARVPAALDDLPRHPRPVHPAVVVGVRGVVGPAGVVEQAELVAHPDHRQPAEAEHDRVSQQDAGGRLRVTRLQSGERGQGPGDAAVAGRLVALEDQPASPGARIGTGVPVGQEAPVGPRVHADGVRVLVGDRPPDVVVAPDVRRPRGRRRRLRHLLQRVGGEPGVAGGEHRPHLDHQPVVVGEVAHPTGVLADAEVGRQVGRTDDRLGLEEHGGSGDAGDRAQRSGELVHLGLVLADRAEPLPDEGDGIEAEDLHPEVGERQDDLGVLAEHGGVRPVDVPLVVVEGRPDPARELLVPGEAAGREVGEDLRQRRLVGVGQLAVVEDVEVGAALGVAGARRGGPRVLARDVVEHQVQAQTDALAAQRRGERAQVVDVAEVGPHRPVVLDGVATVVRARPRRQQRHEVEIGDSEVAEVRHAILDAAQGAGEPVGVRRVAEHRGPLEPVRIPQPPLVELAQLHRAVGVGRARDRHQPVGHSRRGIAAVDPAEGVDQVGRPLREPALEAGVGQGHASQYVGDGRVRHGTWPYAGAS